MLAGLAYLYFHGLRAPEGFDQGPQGFLGLGVGQSGSAEVGGEGGRQVNICGVDLWWRGGEVQ